MDPKLFDELTQSLKQAGAIARGERMAARKFARRSSDIRVLRKQMTRS